MKQSLPPGLVAGVLVAVLVVTGVLMFGCSRGPGGSGTGKIKSDVDFGKAETDPEKLKKGVEDLMRNSKGAK